MKSMRDSEKNFGLTLVEVLVGIALFSLLLGAVVAAFSWGSRGFRKAESMRLAADQGRKVQQALVNTIIEAVRTDLPIFPPDLDPTGYASIEGPLWPDPWSGSPGYNFADTNLGELGDHYFRGPPDANIMLLNERARESESISDGSGSNDAYKESFDNGNRVFGSSGITIPEQDVASNRLITVRREMGTAASVLDFETLASSHSYVDSFTPWGPLGDNIGPYQFFQRAIPIADNNNIYTEFNGDIGVDGSPFYPLYADGDDPEDEEIFFRVNGDFFNAIFAGANLDETLFPFLVAELTGQNDRIGFWISHRAAFDESRENGIGRYYYEPEIFNVTVRVTTGWRGDGAPSIFAPNQSWSGVFQSTTSARSVTGGYQ